jgi:preprotein translocase subunit SecY
MNRFIQTLRNIWNIEELRKRILYTLALLLVYRLGTFIVLPGVNATVLKAMNEGKNQNDLFGLLNTFTGGAFNMGAILALGVMPYITASIVVQLLSIAVPFFQRLQQQEGESGRRKLNMYTRYLTVAITLVQSGAYLTYLVQSKAVSADMPIGWFYVVNVFALTAGTVFSMWLGERITARGIGNGISFIIMAGIVDRLPSAILYEFNAQRSGFLFIIMIAFWLAIIAGTIVIIQGVRRIPLQFAKQIAGRQGAPRGSAANTQLGARDYIPLKLNASGVMPIIFAQALMFLPGTVAQAAVGSEVAASSWLTALTDIYSMPYNIIYFILVVVFTYVYTALIVNPQQYSEYLKRSNAFIPGVKPGQNTADFIDTLTSRITLPGSLFLGFIAILPFFARLGGVNQSFAYFFGGTSLLIMIGVLLDTLQQIETYLLMRKYDGLTESGRIQGRGGVGIQIGQNF